jgi:hypothetical protein
LDAPEMAPVGQRFSHALHPVQASAMIVNGISQTFRSIIE